MQTVVNFVVDYYINYQCRNVTVKKQEHAVVEIDNKNYYSERYCRYK